MSSKIAWLVDLYKESCKNPLAQSLVQYFNDLKILPMATDDKNFVKLNTSYGNLTGLGLVHFKDGYR